MNPSLLAGGGFFFTMDLGPAGAGLHSCLESVAVDYFEWAVFKGSREERGTRGQPAAQARVAGSPLLALLPAGWDRYPGVECAKGFGGAMAGKSSNKMTASAARQLMCRRDSWFRAVTGREKSKIVVALARKGVVVYGQAFDLVHCEPTANLDDEGDISRVLPTLRLYEVKSSNRSLKPGFADYFFSFSTAELLVAQSLGENFRFAFVNIQSGEVLDLSLREVFGRARAIYPSWSIKF